MQVSPGVAFIPQNAPCTSHCPSSSFVTTPQTEVSPLWFQLVLVLAAALFAVSTIVAWQKGKRDRGWNLWSMVIILAATYGLLTLARIYGSFPVTSYGAGASSIGWLAYVPLALILCAAVLVFFWKWQRPDMTLPATPQAAPRRAEAAAVVDGAIYSLHTGSDPRSVILACYRSLCELLQNKGVEGSPSMTAREFESAGRSLLPVSHEAIHRLTSLFERARYSDEDIGPGEAGEAEAVLSEFRVEMAGASVG
ncbi:MAG: DUF4129 domain-containing protein [Nitrososphaerota archaeon]|nr:DUF4129 domain-containing protein [Nitrososphaerota archaeon]